jgi:hypothetical protein
MKALKIIIGLMLLFSVIITSCGDGSTNANKEAEIASGTQEDANGANDSIAATSAQMKIQDSIKVTNFIKRFYSALELSPSLNQKQYEEGGVHFNLNKFKSCVDDRSIYSQLKISNLTGDYHDRYNIRLLSIDSIFEIKNNKVAYTTVEYGIYEVGTFKNLEIIFINSDQNRLTLNKWEDVKIKEMKVAGYEGLETFNEKDFYKTMGSINRSSP